MLIVLPWLLLALPSPLAVSRVAADADPDEGKAVLAVVQAFFDTMAAKDVEGARRTVVPEGRFHSVRERGRVRSVAEDEAIS